LSNPRLLSYCPRAETIFVGKKAAAYSLPQEQINALLIEKARAGKRVVRLKGGDPFVFGRGGEECQALAEAKIPFEIIPGITAAIAAPTYAGIPVTHRDLNSSFTFITGHEKEDEYRDDQTKSREKGDAGDIDWSVIAKLPCIAFYMGVKSLPRICSRLIENGMSPETPAATIQWGTMPMQKTVISTVSRLARDVSEAKLQSPAITIIGKVVDLRSTLSWFENRPLFNQTIAVTRSRHQASELSQRLEELGASVIEAPTIELHEPADIKPIDHAIQSAAKYDWICFTSANGVTATRQRLSALRQDVRIFGQAKIAAVGQATADAIHRDLCLKVDLCPKTFVAEALADELANQNAIAGKRFLFLRADIARPLLRQRLEQAGAAEVNDVPLYETRRAAELPAVLLESLAAGKINWITFTSSSTAKNFVDLLGPDYRQKIGNIKLAGIGPITTQTLRDLKLEPTIQAANFDIPGLISAIISHLEKSK
jgi:uroporphyrinogen III methyltransferase/synthase